jgi:hypothetical protein
LRQNSNERCNEGTGFHLFPFPPPAGDILMTNCPEKRNQMETKKMGALTPKLNADQCINISNYKTPPI